jgi:hypothetical protein
MEPTEKRQFFFLSDFSLRKKSLCFLNDQKAVQLNPLRNERRTLSVTRVPLSRPGDHYQQKGKFH